MARLTLFVALLLAAHAAAFSVVSPQRTLSIQRSQRLFMSSDDEPPVKSAAEFVPGAASNNPVVEVEASYPIPLPSPILLGGAMILGIASIGELVRCFPDSTDYRCCIYCCNQVIALH